MSAFPYLALISTKIVDYQQLAITFTCIPLSSILGPILTGLLQKDSLTTNWYRYWRSFTGFLADKFGNYKSFLVFTSLLGGFIHLPILCLLAQQKSSHEPSINSTHDMLLDVSVTNNSTNQTYTNSSLTHFDYTFPVLMVIRILGYFAMDASNMLLDSCGLAISQTHKAEFGKQKMWATCAMVIIPLICGVLIDVISDYRGLLLFLSLN